VGRGTLEGQGERGAAERRVRVWVGQGLVPCLPVRRLAAAGEQPLPYPSLALPSFAIPSGVEESLPAAGRGPSPPEESRAPIGVARGKRDDRRGGAGIPARRADRSVCPTTARKGRTEKSRSLAAKAIKGSG